MRTLLSRQSAQPLFMVSDDAVIGAIADLVAGGRLHIHAEPAAPHQPLVPRPDPAPVPFPLAQRKGPLKSLTMPRVTLTDLWNLPADMNLDGQAAALIAAAARGAPLCPI